MPYPKISIRFCTRCKWTLRSAWYLQELLQTFGDTLKEVSLVPAEVGEFKILGYRDIDEPEVVIWDRKVDGGFPDSKFLKQRVKSILFEDSITLGAHIERKSQKETLVGADSASKCSKDSADCPDCTI